MKNKLSFFLILFISSAILLSCASTDKTGKVPDPEGTGDYVKNTETDRPAEPVGNSEESPAPVAEDSAVSAAAPEVSAAAGGRKDGYESKSEPAYGLRDEGFESEVMPLYDDSEELSGDMDRSLTTDHMPAGNSAKSGLKAGYSDDNRQYGYFLSFLDEYGLEVDPLSLDVSERIILKVTDRNGNSISGAEIKVETNSGVLEGLTLADGTYQINPSELSGDGALSLEIKAGDAYQGLSSSLRIDRDGARNIEFSFDVDRLIPRPIPLDIVFVMDTTGSMGEEIQRLKETIRIIHMNLSSLSIPAEVRFGMVLYKDQGDEYDTMTIPLTADIDVFQTELDLVQAYGGGDTPEDLELALDVLLNGMDWNPSGIKLAYIITDAPPHLDYGRAYTCASAAKDARRMGIKIYGIGTGGLDLQGEYILRQIAQYTSARYIFLTYGAEEGESAGGEAGSVSHHTGANWNADKLESIIIRFAKEELSYLSDSPLLDEDSWFEADRIETEETEETLANLFGQAVTQLLDFSTWPVSPETPLAVLPFQYEGELGAVSEYFAEHFILSAGTNERIILAERKDISQLLSEIELQNMGLTEEGEVSKIGELLNAQVIVTGSLFVKDDKYELFLKMLRTETGEVLSVTRAVIAAGLGL